MRGYAWGNMYLSSIQQGIQGWHAQNELFNAHSLTAPEIKTFLDWNKNHKTLVLLNGGYGDNLLAIHSTLSTLAQRLKRSPTHTKSVGVKAVPVSLFREEKASLNEAVTSVFTVLPPTCFPARAQRGALFRELGRAGVDDFLSAATERSPIVDKALEAAVGHSHLGCRFMMVTLTGDLAR